MGSFNFRWEHPAEQVFVTGTFDNWGKSVKLDKTGTVHEKTVDLPGTNEKILYKFVADGKWINDHTAKSETDHEGNVNNVLYPNDISASTGAPVISSVAPGASTTQMAGEQPLEKQAGPPGAFPEETPEDNNQTFSVDPIPATGGIGNPVHLQPGEKVPDPSTYTGNTVNSTARHDQASYERSDAGAPVLPPPLSPQSEREAAGASIFGLGPQTSNMIPESSMPMGKDMPPPIDSQDTGPAISSVAPGSTTNQLAGMQPIEPRGVPEVVTDSQKAAGVGPEASASPQAVEEKREVESELQSKVPEAPTAETSRDQPGGKKDNTATEMAAGGVAAAGAAAAGTAYAMRNKAHETTGTDPASALPQSVQDSINNMNNKGTTAPEPVTSLSSLPQQTAAGEPVRVPADADQSRGTTDKVPDVVTTSQKEAHFAPEASASPVAVEEKKDVENELLSKVKESEATGEPAPTNTAATSATAPVSSTEKSATGAPQLSDPTGGGLAPLSMDDKPIDSSKQGLNAPADAPAQPSTNQANQLATQAAPVVNHSRDVSPMTKPNTTGQTQPMVTTGVDSSKAPAESKPVGTPRNGGASSGTTAKRQSIIDKLKGTPDSQKSSASGASATGNGKEKKKGFFGRLKDRIEKK